MILPTFNERENIRDLIHSILGSLTGDVEVIVVDDDSPDETWRVVQELSKETRNVKLLRRIGERGLASAIAAGATMAEGDFLIWMDCDFSHPPEMLPRMVAALRDYDIALGSRYVRGGDVEYPFQLRLVSRLTCLFAQLLLDPSIKDYTGGFCAVRREVLRHVSIKPIGGGHGEYCIAFLFEAKRKGFRIIELPYVCPKRTKGRTKTAPSLNTLFRHGLHYLLSIMKLKLGLK